MPLTVDTERQILYAFIYRKRPDSPSRLNTMVLYGLKASEPDDDRKWQDQTVSIRWSILYVIDHMAQHVGHMQLALKL